MISLGYGEIALVFSESLGWRLTGLRGALIEVTNDLVGSVGDEVFGVLVVASLANGRGLEVVRHLKNEFIRLLALEPL